MDNFRLMIRVSNLMSPSSDRDECPTFGEGHTEVPCEGNDLPKPTWPGSKEAWTKSNRLYYGCHHSLLFRCVWNNTVSFKRLYLLFHPINPTVGSLSYRYPTHAQNNNTHFFSPAYYSNVYASKRSKTTKMFFWGLIRWTVASIILLMEYHEWYSK